jgi:hypothetical protein
LISRRQRRLGYSSETPMFYQKDLALRNTADVTSGKLIATCLQSISGVSAVDPLVAFYDIHGRKREMLFFCSVPDTTRDQSSFFFFLPLSHYVWSVQHNFLSCCDKDFTTGACLTSTFLEIRVGANDCKCNRDQRLNVLSEARRSSR